MVLIESGIKKNSIRENEKISKGSLLARKPRLILKKMRQILLKKGMTIGLIKCSMDEADGCFESLSLVAKR